MTLIASLRVVSGRNGDSDPSILLSQNRRSYLFNVPEQCSRFFTQSEVHQRWISQIFCTSPISSLELSSVIIGHSMPRDVCLPYIGRSNFGSLQFSRSEMHHCSSFTTKCSSSYTDKVIQVSSIEHFSSVSFSVRVSPPRHVDTQKVDSFGIGRSFISEIMGGGFCTLWDGRVIDLDSILEPPIAPIYILFVDCTSLNDLNDFSDLSAYAVIIHFTSIALIRDPAYQSRFPDSALNICFVFDGNGGLSDQFQTLEKYHSANPDLFQLPACEIDSVDNLGHFVSLSSGDLVELNVNGIAVQRKERFQFQTRVIDICEVKSFRVTFLGTSAGFPQLQRQTSGILVQVPDGFILLDCGVGCYPQIRSHFGRSGTESVLRNLNVIWISHMHIDHVHGLVRLLFERSQVTIENVLLCCCRVVQDEVQRIEALFGADAFHVIFDDRSQSVNAAGVVIDSFQVVHCSGSMGCVLTMASGERLAYSGDRLADGQFERDIGTCDVLIHEGTYTSDRKQFAAAYGHTDFDGAMEAAAAVQAKWLFITHISTRVAPRNTVLEEENVIVAFDHLSLEYERMEEGFRMAKQIHKRVIEEKHRKKEEEDDDS